MDSTEKERLEIIVQYPDFVLCGVKIREMKYNRHNQLFFLKRGICRVNSARIISAINSEGYKKYLEKEIRFNGK